MDVLNERHDPRDDEGDDSEDDEDDGDGQTTAGGGGVAAAQEGVTGDADGGDLAAVPSDGVRDFLLLLSLRIPRQEDVDRIADAMERNGITQDALIALSVQAILDRLTPNHNEAAAILHTIADFFFGMEQQLPGPRRRRALFTGDEDQARLKPSKRARLLAAAVVDCALGQAASLCRNSFNETFPIHDFATWQQLVECRVPDGRSIVEEWAERMVLKLRQTYGQQALMVHVENVIAWAREYCQNRKSYKKNAKKVRERSKSRYFQVKGASGQGHEGISDSERDADVEQQQQPPS